MTEKVVKTMGETGVGAEHGGGDELGASRINDEGHQSDFQWMESRLPGDDAESQTDGDIAQADRPGGGKSFPDGLSPYILRV